MILEKTNLMHNFSCTRLNLFSTCFGQPCVHHQENCCISATPGLFHSTQSEINQVSDWYNNSSDDVHMAARNM